jgi:hypothetical protein
MKDPKAKPAVPAEEAVVANSSLNSDVFDTRPLAEAEFAQIVQDAEKGNLTETALQRLHCDQQRATSKRKKAQMSGAVTEAASASAREQAILALEYSFTVLGVRWRRGQKAGARGAGEAAQAKAKPIKERVHQLADEYLKSHYDKHEIAGLIAKRVDRSARQVREHLESHPSGFWKKKRKQP